MERLYQADAKNKTINPAANSERLAGAPQSRA